MCGIAGAFAPDRGRTPGPDVLGAMTAALVHRGPDDVGLLVDPEAGFAFGHRRLSIVDLSPEGHQPMQSAGGRYVLVYNGEVYNHAELAAELRAAGARFRGHSDTEVILAAVEHWGLDASLKRFRGIFALALYDRRERELILVRDHLGVKPLYYAWVDEVLIFGSELKALAEYHPFAGRIDRGALALLLRHNCVPAPYTIYSGVSKLPPGSTLRVRAGAVEPARARPTPFWSARAVAEAGARAPLQLTDAEAVERLDGVVRRAVAEQMQADVPLGAFLSGGIDSSVVVALMQAQSARPVRTFTIGNTVAAFDEAGAAAAVARHLGTEHVELYVSGEDALRVVPELPRLYDEPFADSSQIPTYLVSALARQHVTVALSGDGGDELFAGYNRHVLAARLWRRMRVVPTGVRRAVAGALTGIPSSAWDRGARMLRGQEGLAGYNVHKFAGALRADDPEHLYRTLASHWQNPAAVVLGAREPDTLLSDPSERPDLPTLTERMMYLDAVTYLPDDILTKVDRASMAVSLEARVPLLDPRVFEFAWSLPLHQKLRGGEGKWALRRVLDRYVPRALVDRPKSGFGVPVGTWLRGPLRDWAESLLASDRLRADGFFDVGAVRRLWDAHVLGRGEWQYHLWDVLMFQAWYHDAARRA